MIDYMSKTEDWPVYMQDPKTGKRKIDRKVKHPAEAAIDAHLEQKNNIDK